MPRISDIVLDDETIQLMRASPAWYAYVTSEGTWYPAPHHLLLSEALVDVAEGRCPRLIVVEPPRHGKSEFISVKFPQWLFGKRPTTKIICSSYAGGLSRDFSWRARDEFAEWGPQVFGYGIDPRGNAAADNWSVYDVHTGRITGGRYLATGIRGSVTGRGANVLLIDDPVKDDRDANSRNIRRQTIEWYKATASTRLERDHAEIIVMTRWHENDLVGYLLSEMRSNPRAPRWRVLRLPAVAEVPSEEWPADPLGRIPGDPLWPEMFDRDRLAEIKENLGAYWWNALYQGRPSEPEGAIFKRQWFRYFDLRKVGDEFVFVLFDENGKVVGRVPKAKCRIFSVADLAISTDSAADYTVVSTFAVTPDRQLLVLDVRRGHLEATDQITLIVDVNAKWRPGRLLIESVSYQRSLVSLVLQKGVPAVPVYPDRDAHARAVLPATLMAAGRIFFRRGAPWLYEWEDELLSFIAGKEAEHDDQVDTLSYGALEISTAGPSVIGL